MSTSQPKVTTPEIDSDSPIHAPEDDLFGIDPFAQMVARSITASSSGDGIVLAIDGPWGSGKTSAINLIRYHLPKLALNTTIEIVPFNPWWFTGSDALARAFFSALGTAIAKTKAAEVRRAFRGFLSRLSKWSTYKGAAERAAGSGLPSGAIQVIFGISSVEPAPSARSHELRKHRSRFLVVIDDIDRLNPSEMLETFALVKSVGRLPNVTYLLAFDRSVTERTITAHLQTNGSTYLEKIVQAWFDLPLAPSETLRDLVVAEATTLFGLSEDDDDGLLRFMNLFYDVVLPYIRRPRDVVRLLGTIRATWPAVKGNVDPGDFLSIETLRLFNPMIYKNVRPRSEEVCGRLENERDPRQTRAAEYDRLLLDGIPDQQHASSRRALERLFPRLEGIWSNHLYSGEFETDWALARRVCSKPHFPTYFQYSLDEDTLPSSERDALLAHAGDREFTVQTLCEAMKSKRRRGGTRAGLILDELNIVADSIPEDVIEPLLSSLFGIADDLIAADSGRHAFSFGNNLLRLRWLLQRLLLKRFDLSHRSEILLTACQNSAIAWLADLASSCLQDYFPRNGSKPESVDRCLVDLDTAERLKELALEKIRAAAKDSSLVTHPGLLSLLFRWRELSGDDGHEVRAWTAEAINEDGFVLRLVSSGLTRSVSQTIGDRVARIRDRAQVDGLETIIDVPRFRARLDAIKGAPDIPDDDRDRVARFLSAWRDQDANPHR